MILLQEKFRGKLTINGETIVVDLGASIDDTGELEMSVDPFFISPSSIPSFSPKFLYKVGKRDITKTRLYCKSKSGKTLESNSIVITGYREHHDKNNLFKICLKLKAMKTKLKYKIPHRRNTLLLSFCVSNFKCLWDGRCQTRLGVVTVYGNPDKSNQQTLTGGIELEESKKHFSSCWEKKAEEQLDRMLTLMSFANGEKLSLNMVQFYNKDTAEVTIFSNDKKITPNAYPPIDHQFFEQFLKAAVQTIEDKEIDDDKWSAITRSINIMLSGSIYDELILVSQVIALVTLERAYIDLDTKFKKDKSIKNNRASLMEQMTGLLSNDKWRINESLIEDKQNQASNVDAVKHVQRIRDEVTHRGKSYHIDEEDAELHDSIILLREIFNRIILSILGYQGSYFCYVGGKHIRSFPDFEQNPNLAPKLKSYTLQPEIVSKINHLISLS